MKKNLTPLALLLALAAASTDASAQVNPYRQTFGTGTGLSNVMNLNGDVTAQGGTYSAIAGAGTGTVSSVINTGIQAGLGTGSQYYLASGTGNGSQRNSRLLVSNITQVNAGHFYAAFNLKTDLASLTSFQFYVGDGGATGFTTGINNPLIGTALRVVRLADVAGQQVHNLEYSLNGSSWTFLAQFTGESPVNRLELYSNIQTTSATYFRGTCSQTPVTLPNQSFHVYVNGDATPLAGATGGLTNGNGSNDQINDIAFVTNETGAKVWIDNLVYAADLSRPTLIGNYMMDEDFSDISRPNVLPDVFTAIARLNCLNNSGAVTFSLAPSTQISQTIQLNEYAHGITLNGNNSTISLCTKSTSNEVNLMKLIGTDNVTINGFNMVATCTYGTGILLTGGNTNVTIQNNTINVQVPGPMTTSAHNNGIMANGAGPLTINNNTILGGRKGVFVQNPTGAVTITNNTLTDAYEFAIGLQNANVPVISNNTIRLRTSPFGSVGIQASGLNGFTMNANYISDARRNGISLDNSNMGAGASKSSITNNRIGNFQPGTGFSTGMTLINVGGTDIDHNSIKLNTGTGGAAMYLGAAAGLKLRNNIFHYEGASSSSYAFYGSLAGITNMSNNNFWATGTSNFVFLTQNVATMANLLTHPSGFGAGSKNVNADFSFHATDAALDMLTQNYDDLADAGTADIVVSHDCFGIERGDATNIGNGISDIGANEIAAPITRFANAAVTVDAQVYPNPFASALTVQLNNMLAGQVQVTLTDLMGRQVYSNSYNVEAGASNLVVNANERMAQGVYLLQVRQGNANSTFRVVKQ